MLFRSIAPELLEVLFDKQTECALCWSTADGWPVGVMHRYVWRDGKFWITTMGHRKRVPALRKRNKVSTPASKLRARVLDVLADEGYIRGYSLVEKPGAFPEFEIELKYFDGEPVIAEISRVSKPGRRVYSSIKDLKPIKNGLGISILSTSKGVMSDAAARDANVGGEVLCRVY